jgi:hypothetical protein
MSRSSHSLDFIVLTIFDHIIKLPHPPASHTCTQVFWLAHAELIFVKYSVLSLYAYLTTLFQQRRLYSIGW